MSSIRIKDKQSNKLDMRGAKELFEHGIRRQREPSPAPTKMAGSHAHGSKSSISSFKQRFEQFTAPKSDTPALIRKANSVDNVATATASKSMDNNMKSASGSRAEKRWLSARTQIYEQLSNDKMKSSKRSKSDLDVCEISTIGKPAPDKKLGNKEDMRGEKIEVTPISDRINKFKYSDNSTSETVDNKKLQGGSSPSLKEKKTAVRDLTEAYSKTLSPPSKDTLARAGKFSAKTQSEQPKTLNTTKKSENDRKDDKKDDRKDVKKTTNQRGADDYNNNKYNDGRNHKPSNNNSRSNDKKSVAVRTVHEVTDHTAARTFMEELIMAIDNEQHIPMKQLIDLFEKMKEDNSSMRDMLEKMRAQLDKTDIEDLNKTLRTKLEETEEKLRQSQAQIDELTAYRQALEESEQRCEELEELNHQQLQELEYVRLEMDELKDQYHDDEVHETIILQQRLDDMARSLRIIHFRLKKADARLQETEREKESLLEEIRILQGGTFTDEEIKRMQSLEGDLQSAKEVSVQLHMQLEKSEERQEKLEAEASRLRDEIKTVNLENERLRNNLHHLQEQMSNDATKVGSTNSLQIPPALGALGRQGSANEVDTLKNNLESAIERENDLKEQLKYAEEEARMLRKRLRDIEHENDALTKQLHKLSQLAHSKGDQAVSMALTSKNIQAEVIQLENKELRSNNDKLHQHIDDLQTQVKSLQVKLDLLQREQDEGPQTNSRNSLYYETKFELMTKEIDHLRLQLREREKEYRDLLEVEGQSRRQLRRAITIDCDKIDQRKQLEIMRHDADILRDRLRQLERDNERLEKENRQYSVAAAGRQPSLEEENQQLSSRISSLERENTELLEQLHQQELSDKQQKLLEEVERDNSRLVTELSYLRKSKPDIVSLVNDLQHSEEKILTYENEISSLRDDMSKMECNLQDDINSLSMKNSILRSLLEAINQHEGPESSSTASSSAASVSNKQSSSDRADMELEVEHDSLIAGHISRLPQDIQKQFRDKIECLEAQLKEERERARAAEGLLHQVKLHLKSCVLSSPLVQMMQPKRAFRYPSPPPSLIIKPSPYNSPSHPTSRSSRANSLTSTPERLKVGPSLVAQMYLGNFPSGSLADIKSSEQNDDDILLVSLQQSSSSVQEPKVKATENHFEQTEIKDDPNNRGRDKVNGGSNGVVVHKLVQNLKDDSELWKQQTSPAKHRASTNSITALSLVNLDSSGVSKDTGKSNCDVIKKAAEQKRKSSLRRNFYENYSSHVANGFRTKKKVSFALPGGFERDTSDLSISSHLSAASDCTVLDDDDEESRGSNIM